MTRTITTAAELDALPEGSVAMTADGRPLHKSTWADDAPAWFEGAQRWAMTSVSILDVAGPLTVLHDPSEARAESAPAVPAHVCTTHCEQGRGHYPAPAAPVVSDAAVEAAARALRIEEVGDSAPPGFAARQWDIGETPREKPVRLARAALSDALPHLGAAPSATREDVAGALEREFGCFLAHNPHDRDRFWGGAADALLARFTITPRTDR